MRGFTHALNEARSSRPGARTAPRCDSAESWSLARRRRGDPRPLDSKRGASHRDLSPSCSYTMLTTRQVLSGAAVLDGIRLGCRDRGDFDSRRVLTRKHLILILLTSSLQTEIKWLHNVQSCLAKTYSVSPSDASSAHSLPMWYVPQARVYLGAHLPIFPAVKQNSPSSSQ